MVLLVTCPADVALNHVAIVVQLAHNQRDREHQVHLIAHRPASFANPCDDTMAIHLHRIPV